MKILAYRENDLVRMGLLTEIGLLSVQRTAGALGLEAPAHITALLSLGKRGQEQLSMLQSQAERLGINGLPPACLLREEDLVFEPCVPNPGKILCIGLNYRKHAVETGADIPETPVVFGKFNNALAAHDQDVVLPAASRMVDYEAELAIVMGQRTRNVSREEALSGVFGYCCANDLSARDLQKRTSQWLLGKTCEGFSPLGPYLVTADEVPDPNALAIGSRVNGEVRQNSSTRDMIFACDEIISYLSRHMTLEPGDVILTGTPEGVVFGMPEADRVYLTHGDVVTVEVEGLGVLRNRMVEDR